LPYVHSLPAPLDLTHHYFGSTLSAIHLPSSAISTLHVTLCRSLRSGFCRFSLQSVLATCARFARSFWFLRSTGFTTCDLAVWACRHIFKIASWGTLEGKANDLATICIHLSGNGSLVPANVCLDKKTNIKDQQLTFIERRPYAPPAECT